MSTSKLARGTVFSSNRTPKDIVSDEFRKDGPPQVLDDLVRRLKNQTDDLNKVAMVLENLSDHLFGLVPTDQKCGESDYKPGSKFGEISECLSAQDAAMQRLFDALDRLRPLG